MREKIMGMIERLKEAYEFTLLGLLYAGGLACFVVFLYFVLFTRGAVWLSDNIFPWFEALSNYSLLILVVIVLPLAFFGRTRLAAAYGLIFLSFICALVLWVLSFLQAYVFMQVPSSFIGRFLFGLFAVPIAILGALIERDGTTLVKLLFLSIFVSALLWLGVWILKKEVRLKRKSF
jgi:hypothetical protein